jgi:hypothetical protein
LTRRLAGYSPAVAVSSGRSAAAVSSSLTEALQLKKITFFFQNLATSVGGSFPKASLSWHHRRDLYHDKTNK